MSFRPHDPALRWFAGIAAGLVLTAGLVLSVLLLYWLAPATRRALYRENSVIEWATALLFLGGAVIGAGRLPRLPRPPSFHSRSAASASRWPTSCRSDRRGRLAGGGKIPPGRSATMVTLLTESGEYALAEVEASTTALWCPAHEAGAATGWMAKPEGLCRGAVCVPLPAGRESEFVDGGRINLAALWRQLGQPALRSERGHVWVLSESARERTAALASLEAPDFALPDPSGRMHRLSDYRGKKVFLVTWASW